MERTLEFQFRLDLQSGVPAYRQIIDQVLLAIADGRLEGYARLPTVRQTAVDLAVNPNTVQRAYRELEIRGILTTQQGSGTFVRPTAVSLDEAVRRERLSRLAAECAARAGAESFQLHELIAALEELRPESRKE